MEKQRCPRTFGKPWEIQENIWFAAPFEMNLLGSQNLAKAVGVSSKRYWFQTGSFKMSQRAMEHFIFRDSCKVQNMSHPQFRHFKQLEESLKSGPHLNPPPTRPPAQSPRWQRWRSPPHRFGPSTPLVPGWGRWRRRSPPLPSCCSARSPRHRTGTWHQQWLGTKWLGKLEDSHEMTWNDMKVSSPRMSKTQRMRWCSWFRMTSMTSKVFEMIKHENLATLHNQDGVAKAICLLKQQFVCWRYPPHGGKMCYVFALEFGFRKNMLGRWECEEADFNRF